jgi:DNA-binding transcriptional MerR regulator
VDTLNLADSVWDTETVTGYLRTRLAGRKGLTPATVRRWAKKRLIPANRQDGHWYFEPALIMRWVYGGPLLRKFHLAKDPRRALGQIRELVAYLCHPENQEGNPFLEAAQENFCSAVRAVISQPNYRKIRQTVKDLCETFRENPGLACLEEVPGLFEG